VAAKSEGSAKESVAATAAAEEPAPVASWGGIFSKAVSSLLLPTQVSEVLAQAIIISNGFLVVVEN